MRKNLIVPLVLCVCACGVCVGFVVKANEAPPFRTTSTAYEKLTERWFASPQDLARPEVESILGGPPDELVRRKDGTTVISWYAAHPEPRRDPDSVMKILVDVNTKGMVAAVGVAYGPRATESVFSRFCSWLGF
jgi:hypothetical protein